MAQNKQINIQLRREIISVLRDILDDPDFGLELTEGVKKRLTKSLASNKKGVSLSQIKKKYS